MDTSLSIRVLKIQRNGTELTGNKNDSSTCSFVFIDRNKSSIAQPLKFINSLDIVSEGEQRMIAIVVLCGTHLHCGINNEKYFPDYDQGSSSRNKMAEGNKSVQAHLWLLNPPDNSCSS